jgi:hypothetical protein
MNSWNAKKGEKGGDRSRGISRWSGMNVRSDEIRTEWDLTGTEEEGLNQLRRGRFDSHSTREEWMRNVGRGVDWGWVIGREGRSGGGLLEGQREEMEGRRGEE